MLGHLIGLVQRTERDEDRRLTERRRRDDSKLVEGYRRAQADEPDSPGIPLRFETDRCGTLVAPRSDIDMEVFANATVTTVEGGEWIQSDMVWNTREVR